MVAIRMQRYPSFSDAFSPTSCPKASIASAITACSPTPISPPTSPGHASCSPCLRLWPTMIKPSTRPASHRATHIRVPLAAAAWWSSKPSSRAPHPDIPGNAHRRCAGATFHDAAKPHRCPGSPLVHDQPRHRSRMADRSPAEPAWQVIARRFRQARRLTPTSSASGTAIAKVGLRAPPSSPPRLNPHRRRSPPRFPALALLGRWSQRCATIYVVTASD